MIMPQPRMVVLQGESEVVFPRQILHKDVSPTVQEEKLLELSHQKAV